VRQVLFEFTTGVAPQQHSTATATKDSPQDDVQQPHSSSSTCAVCPECGSCDVDVDEGIGLMCEVCGYYASADDWEARMSALQAEIEAEMEDDEQYPDADEFEYHEGDEGDFEAEAALESDFM